MEHCKHFWLAPDGWVVSDGLECCSHQIINNFGCRGATEILLTVLKTRLNCAFDEQAIRWKPVLMKTHFDENPFQWKPTPPQESWKKYKY